jgi:two-component system, NtrC family, sensor kinase
VTLLRRALIAHGAITLAAVAGVAALAPANRSLAGAAIVLLAALLLHFLLLRRLLSPMRSLVEFARRASQEEPANGAQPAAVPPPLTIAPAATISPSATTPSSASIPPPATLAPPGRRDEIGELAGGFNRLAAGLRETRGRLEERTLECRNRASETERARADLALAQQRVADLSRMSGMAEVATGVLHNVGNVLNSLNVSSTIAAGKIAEFRVDNLVTVIDTLQQHSADIGPFLHQDPKGQRLLPYLNRLGKKLQEDRQAVLIELRQLQNHVGHIKTIVSTQQNYARVSGLVEDISLAELVDDALQIVQPGLDRHGIRTECAFEDLPPVSADRHKILQILLNILRNAKETIKQSRNEPRCIRIAIRRHGGNWVRIEVKDSGIGLAPGDLTRIFAHGFTTKRDGHGFGLHSGALAAQEMSGSLWAESEGAGLGATFVLELPLVKVQDRSLA